MEQYWERLLKSIQKLIKGTSIIDRRIVITVLKNEYEFFDFDISDLDKDKTSLTITFGKESHTFILSWKRNFNYSWLYEIK